MKRVLIVCTAAFAALLLPGAASGGTVSPSVYLGDLDAVEGSEVKLKARIGNGEKRVVSFAVRNVPVDCEGNEKFILPRVVLRGRIPVEQRHFAVKDDNGTTTFEVEGRLGVRKVTGRFRYFGSMDTGEQMRDCDTGGRSFTARLSA